eukprot:CAMPEP_0114254300 /NCGR_PEP_ID=MMETSP0058-20121206/16903_1 /TAXON_ID=36894 /ORGANISM="Pyramimonas parkeae, CCMP726" /LENGTH=70 /DNA_ID=CAMNT_0001368505 /DNA_START=641 /DNA_END=853 /DNA_ORIENTATION=-
MVHCLFDIAFASFTQFNCCDSSGKQALARYSRLAFDDTSAAENANRSKQGAALVFQCARGGLESMGEQGV